jgi:cation diffusion facilitator family transporter
MAKMPLAEHNNMVKTIPSDRTDEPLRISVLPWRPWRGRPIPYLASAWLLRGGEHDLNIRGAFLHLLADAAVSLGVVAAGGVILATGWYWVDPAVSLVISAVIVWGTWGLLRDAVNLSLHAVPTDIEPADVREYLATLPDVSSGHDLHVWAMSTTETAATTYAHIDITSQFSRTVPERHSP